MKRRKPVLETYHSILKTVRRETRNDTGISKSRIIRMVGLSYKTGAPYLEKLTRLELLNVKKEGERTYYMLTPEGTSVFERLDALMKLLG